MITVTITDVSNVFQDIVYDIDKNAIGSRQEVAPMSAIIISEYASVIVRFKS